MKTLSGDHWKIHVADVMEGLAAIPAGSVHCVVTSPPYWQLRDYGYEGQIGLESTPDSFVESLVNVFRGVGRAMRDDGVLFMNLGDSYASQKSGSRMPAQTVAGGKIGKGEFDETRGLPTDERNPRRDASSYGMAGGNQIGIPWRVALAMQADGWILRKEIVWYKPSPMPESVTGWRWRRCRNKVPGTGWTKETRPESHQDGLARTRADIYNGREDAAKWTECEGCDKCRDTDGYVLFRGAWRPTTSHEHIFMFSKSSRYFCDGDGSKEPTTGNAHGRGTGVNPKSKQGTVGHERQNESFSAAVRDIVETRNMRSVWKISFEAYKKAHFATYPTELVRRCLIAGTSRGGCCSACGAQYAPIVDSDRIATRPGIDSKVNRVSVHPESPYQTHAGTICGNRDPKRHTTVTSVLGYLPTCRCAVPAGRPIVLDPFSGSATTGQVAINMGCDYIGLEANPVYAELGVERLETPWVPVAERREKPAKKSRRRHKRQSELF